MSLCLGGSALLALARCLEDDSIYHSLLPVAQHCWFICWLVLVWSFYCLSVVVVVCNFANVLKEILHVQNSFKEEHCLFFLFLTWLISCPVSFAEHHLNKRIFFKSNLVALNSFPHWLADCLKIFVNQVPNDWVLYLAKFLQSDNKMVWDLRPADTFCGPEQNLQTFLANYFSKLRYSSYMVLTFSMKTIEFQHKNGIWTSIYLRFQIFISWL